MTDYYFRDVTESARTVRKPRNDAWMSVIGNGLLDWDSLKAWRAECQREGDRKDQPKPDRKMWQRRAKAARIVCDMIQPKTGSGPMVKDLPAELEAELALAVTMGAS